MIFPALLNQVTLTSLAVGYSLSAGTIGAFSISQSTGTIARQITDQLDILSISMWEDGYVEVFSYIDEIGLKQGETRSWILPLNADQTYIITAVCDNDCQNIELELWQQEQIVVADRANNPYPRITWTLEDDSPYRATVVMRECQIEPCYSGLRVFAQTAED